MHAVDDMTRAATNRAPSKSLGVVDKPKNMDDARTAPGAILAKIRTETLCPNCYRLWEDVRASAERVAWYRFKDTREAEAIDV